MPRFLLSKAGPEIYKIVDALPDTVTDADHDIAVERITVYFELARNKFVKRTCFVKQDAAHPKLLMNVALDYEDVHNIATF